MLGKLLCFIGWHKYQRQWYPHKYQKQTMERKRVCLRCDKIQFYWCPVHFTEDEWKNLDNILKERGIKKVKED